MGDLKSSLYFGLANWGTPGYNEFHETMPLPLSDNVVEVWVVDLQASRQRVEYAFQLLSDDERHRAEQFRFPVHRDRFVMARASLRRILATYFEIEPTQLAFRYSEYGKPSLVTPQTDIRFNVSRSHDKALIACSRGREIGVDTERICRDLDVDDLAQRFFSVAENDRLREVPPNFRHLAFLRCWTCKEAFVKAVGMGLSFDLDKFDVSVALSNPAAFLSASTQEFTVNGWSLIAFGTAAVEGHVSAVVTRGAEVNKLSLSVRPWPQ
jgi:4'-phosphopantetheinyl transferase